MVICNRAAGKCSECYHSRPHKEVGQCKTQRKCYGSPDGDKQVECTEVKE